MDPFLFEKICNTLITISMISYFLLYFKLKVLLFNFKQKNDLTKLLFIIIKRTALLFLIILTYRIEYLYQKLILIIHLVKNTLFLANFFNLVETFLLQIIIIVHEILTLFLILYEIYFNYAFYKRVSNNNYNIFSFSYYIIKISIPILLLISISCYEILLYLLLLWYAFICLVCLFRIGIIWNDVGNLRIFQFVMLIILNWITLYYLYYFIGSPGNAKAYCIYPNIAVLSHFFAMILKINLVINAINISNQNGKCSKLNDCCFCCIKEIKY